MKRLLILRHAKSSWTDPTQEDHDRPLNARGRKGAETLGHWIRDAGLAPGEILCSSAARTQETAALMDLGSPIHTHRNLYLASPETLAAHIADAHGETVMVLAHNPGIGAFAAECLAKPPNHPRFADYPTGALTVAGFDIDTWSDLRPRTGTCLNFVIPSDIF